MELKVSLNRENLCNLKQLILNGIESILPYTAVNYFLNFVNPQWNWKKPRAYIEPSLLLLPVNPQWNWKNEPHVWYSYTKKLVNPQWNWKFFISSAYHLSSPPVNPQWNWKRIVYNKIVIIVINYWLILNGIERLGWVWLTIYDIDVCWS